MTSRYVVFQYLPDPLTDERINIGVATTDAAGRVMHTRFLSNWSRVKSFGGKDVKFLRDFAHEVGEAATPSLFTDAEGEITFLFDRAPKSWINSIQVSAPRASTKTPSELLEDVSRRFLRTHVARHRTSRTRLSVRDFAYDAVVSALDTAGVQNAQRHVTRPTSVEGAVESHEYDLGVQNGHPVTAALAMSFERQNRYQLQRDYAAAAWALEDVRKRSPDLALAVLMIPPVSTSKIYDQARHVFERLDARPVPEDEIEGWATEIVTTLAPS